MVVGGWRVGCCGREEKRCARVCVLVCVHVCVRRILQVEGRRKFRLRLQGKAPTWPKLPEPAGGTVPRYLMWVLQQQDSRSGQRARGASPRPIPMS